MFWSVYSMVTLSLVAYFLLEGNIVATVFILVFYFMLIVMELIDTLEQINNKIKG